MVLSQAAACGVTLNAPQLQSLKVAPDSYMQLLQLK